LEVETRDREKSIKRNKLFLDSSPKAVAVTLLSKPSKNIENNDSVSEIDSVEDIDIDPESLSQMQIDQNNDNSDSISNLNPNSMKRNIFIPDLDLNPLSNSSKKLN